MTLDMFVAPEPRLAVRKVAGEIVVLAADDSSLYVLNEVATAIWEAADGRTTLRDIIATTVCRSYDIDRTTAEQDALELVQGLAGSGVLRLLDRPLASEGD